MMTQEIRSFAVTVPVGTAIASPLITAIGFPPRIANRIEIRIPPGPAGAVGFALAMAGQPIIPFNAGQWIIGDDESLDWPINDYPNSGAWQLIAYNLGRYPHTLYVRFLVDTIPGGAGAVDLTPSLTDLSTIPTQAESDTAAAQASLDELLAGTDITVP